LRCCDKKLSLINRTEISRSELSLPPIEYDTFGLYICADPHSLGGFLGERFGPGVHALSHAILAVAPLFAPGLTRDDFQCDHEFYAPTQVILFDERAGGSGCVAQIWESFFKPNGILEAAIELLENCSMCSVDPSYDAGCPACLHSSNCIKFNMHLSKSAAIIVGKHMLDRLQSTERYKRNAESCDNIVNDSVISTPRRKARKKAMRKAMEMHSARDRQFVVARAPWPLDGEHEKQVFG
jgi:DEAD/DEAH box helicase domain-containing protein